MHPEEYLDVVNENDEVVGKRLRAELYAEGNWNFRVVNAFLRNSKGELWIPRRSEKKTMPLALDFSVGGHVGSGETYDEAFARETSEEINIDITEIPYRVLGQLTPKDGPTAFEKIYEIQSDETPDYNRDDFVEYFWLTPAELVDRIEKGEQAKSDIAPLVRRFYLS